MPFVTVASAKDVSPGRGTLVEAAGRKVALFLHDGQYYALDNACPHRGASLAQGTCENGELHCPLHDARFELATGRHLCPPAKSDVRSYPVRVEGDDIQVEFDSLGSAAPPPAPRPEWSKSKKHSHAAPAAVATAAAATAVSSEAPAGADAPASTATAEVPRKKRVRVEVEETPAHLTGAGLFFSGLLAGLTAAGLVLGGLLYMQNKAHNLEATQLRDALEVARQQVTEAPAERMVTEAHSNPEDVKRIQELGDALVDDLRLQRIDVVYQMMTPECQQRYKKEELAETLQKVTSLKWVVESKLQRRSTVRRAFGGKGYDYHCTAALTSSIGLLQILATFVPSPTGNEWLIARIDFAQEK